MRVTVATIKAKRQEIERNIEEYIKFADKFDLTNSALVWYNAAHSVAAMMALQFKASIELVSAIIAILSPMVYWAENLKDAYEMLSGNDDYAFKAYGRNVEKAFNALIENKPELANSVKVYNFYMSILHPENDDSCTVDIWTLRALSDDYMTERNELYKLFNTTGKQELIIDIIKGKAKQHNITPSQLQSILWAVAQHKAGFDRQTEPHPVLDLWESFINTIE